METNNHACTIAIHDLDDGGYNTIGQRIRQCRIKKGMSMKELADKLGRDYTFVSKYECNQRTPKDDLLIEIGNILGVSHLYLKYGQYYDEIDDYGGIAIHYYSASKHNSKEKETNEAKRQHLEKMISFISQNLENGETDYIKILDDIANYMWSHTNSNKKTINKMLKKAGLYNRNNK